MQTPEMWRVWVAAEAPEPIVAPCQIGLGDSWYDVVVMHKDQMALKGTRPVWYCVTHHLGFDYDMRVPSLSGQLGDRCPVSRLEEWRAHLWEMTA